ncbi:MAG TPA: zinc-dependent alcohol dehydrogenase family protein [Vicinamibacterales bacterium]|jgi:propanol-preferring alcohol dehydrogenase|nr:zinc-dependent alcohol dehydrogenase family protein [Vicinamibacterales bacterium]
MALTHAGAGSLEASDRDVPIAQARQVLVKIDACGVCRTDLHLVDGELPPVPLPVVPGHQIVGAVAAMGDEVVGFTIGQRVGIPWLGYTCGECAFCRSGRENLCVNARMTGYHMDGGYAEYVVADARYTFALPGGYSHAEAAPLLCAGLIGYRAYRMAGDGRRLGLYGFGAAAHIIAQVAVHDGRDVYAFTSPGDDRAQQLARSLGAVWAGASTEAPPETLDAAILFAPVGALVPEALSRVARGGVVVCAGIHMSDIPRFPYELLWEERMVRSVANLTRQDAREFLAIASAIRLQTHVQPYNLIDANRALDDLRGGRVNGAAVLLVQP